MPSVVLFDVDGVLAVPSEPFSVVYSRSQGLAYEPFGEFFETAWKDFVIGKRDIKQEIAENVALWQWTDAPEKLLKMWHDVENVQNKPLTKLIEKINRGVTARVLWRASRTRLALSISGR